MGESILIDTQFSIGEVVKVKNDPDFPGVKFKIEACTIHWYYPEGKLFLKYSGLVKKNDSRSFYEPMLEKCTDNLDGYTWDISEGDIVIVNEKEWTVIDIKKEQKTGEPYREARMLILERDRKNIEYILNDRQSIKKVGHKQKTFV